MDDNKKELIKILGLNSTSSWGEIFVEVGKLQERSMKETIPFHPQFDKGNDNLYPPWQDKRKFYCGGTCSG